MMEKGAAEMEESSFYQKLYYTESLFLFTICNSYVFDNKMGSHYWIYL